MLAKGLSRIDDSTVAHRHDPVGGCGVIAHEQHRRAVKVEVLQKLEDVAGCMAVEVSRRFIRHQDPRVTRQSASDGDSLLLPSGELQRKTVSFVAESHPVEVVAGAGCAFCNDTLSTVLRRHRHQRQ